MVDDGRSINDILGYQSLLTLDMFEMGQITLLHLNRTQVDPQIVCIEILEAFVGLKLLHMFLGHLALFQQMR